MGIRICLKDTFEFAPGRCLAALTLLLVLPACTPGFFYTRITEPLVRNMDETPRGTRVVRGNSQLIKEPISGAGVTVEWASHALGDVAKEKGLTRIHYADLETFSIFGGVYRRKLLLIYGAGDDHKDTVRE